jgi:hypothetical protein
MKDDRLEVAMNQHARLYIRTGNREGTPRFLACDPMFTDELWTWTEKFREAQFFSLDRLPELLAYARGRKRQTTVRLWTPDGTTRALAERDRKPVDR